MKKIIVILALVAAVSGCISENTGSSTIVGEQFALPEITDSSDSVVIRSFESIKGARIWTAKDSKVSVEYQNCYTNTYLGCVETKEYMKLKVEIEPLQVDGAAKESVADESAK